MAEYQSITLKERFDSVGLKGHENGNQGESCAFLAYEI